MYADEGPRHTGGNVVFPQVTERIFTDKASGKLARRPELDESLRMLRAGTSW
jgi:DNA invertase Pin-like site-specific DNA recombinase